VGARFFAPFQTGRVASAASCTRGTGSFLEVAMTTHLPRVPRLKKRRALPLLPFWAFMACSRVNFAFTFLPLLMVGLGGVRASYKSTARLACLQSMQQDSRTCRHRYALLEMIRLVFFIVVGHVCYSYFCDCGK
jgi:hypothetical protein